VASPAKPMYDLIVIDVYARDVAKETDFDAARVSREKEREKNVVNILGVYKSLHHFSDNFPCLTNDNIFENINYHLKKKKRG